MEAIKIINNVIDNRYPTFNKALEGSSLKKVAFVFLSVLTAGILPLSLIMYDIANDLINERSNYSVVLFNKWSFSVSDDFLKNFISVAVTVGLFGTVFLLKKAFNVEIVSPLKNGVSDLTSTYLNIFNGKMQEIRSAFTKLSNGINYSAKLALGFVFGYIAIKNLVKALRNLDDPEESRSVKRLPGSSSAPSAPSAPSETYRPIPRGYKSVYPTLPPRRIFNSDSTSGRPPAYNPFR